MRVKLFLLLSFADMENFMINESTASRNELRLIISSNDHSNVVLPFNYTRVEKLEIVKVV